MMSHRDMGYGYMPQAIPTYSAAQAYHSSMAGMPVYYPDLSRQLSISQNSTYIPNLGYSRYFIPQEQVTKRRRRNSTERRHQTPSITTSRVSSIIGTGLEESRIQTSPIDMYSMQAPLQTSMYSAERFQRAHSYEGSNSYEASNLIQDGYRATSLVPTYNMNQDSISNAPSYSTTYTMASMNPSMSSLIPPPMMPSPSSQHSYPGTDHSSPLLAAPLPPQVTTSPHLEPLMIDTRREKPQCWDHGCNGREFSTFSNLLRHQREKSGSAAKSYCPKCGAEFTRTTARNGHMEHGKCKSRRTSGITNQADPSASTSLSGGSVR